MRKIYSKPSTFKVYYSEKELVEFGKYLLSDKRKQLIEMMHPENSESTKYVYHADISNFKIK